jgi:hypothetical protein
MTQVDPSIVSVGGAIAAIMAAITNGVLAKITYDYMKETRLIFKGKLSLASLIFCRVDLSGQICHGFHRTR